MGENLLSITEAGALLGIKRSAVYYHITQGRLHLVYLPPQKGPGGYAFVRRAEVEALRTKRDGQAVSSPPA